MHYTGNAEKSSEYYDAIYSDGYSTAAYQGLYQHVTKTIKNIKSASVLEIGAGLGDLGKMLVDENISYRGFDFSEEGIKLCQKLCPESKFWVGDAYNEDNYLPHDYNVVVALEVLEHLDDIFIMKQLPPNTHFIGSVPNHDDNASHLRLCEDPKKDIIERFAPFMKVTEMYGLAGSKDPSMILYLFHGVTHAKKKEF